MSRGNITSDQIRDDNKHGTQTALQMSDGTGAAGNYAKFNADGSLTDGGTPAGAMQVLVTAAGSLIVTSDGGLILVISGVQA